MELLISDELLVNSMRKLTQSEIYIIDKLVNDSNLVIKLYTSLNNYFCEDSLDGGMGSIKILTNDYNTIVEPILKTVDVQLIYQDLDKSTVSITLLLDQDNNLKELDCFKMDFSPLCEPLNKNNPLSLVKLS
ncbi:hypothetical protein SAMN05421733_103243 [Acinetobacter boissieri]|uniref:DUF6984 domain-containing protein n=2 Tax=Acinetobacter boissieri TaxID=1219383 RepID=A0A1G6H4A6_9GAMM|nr:hypothetical protein SAMN05421733_103243 [Acinetobacter boissieri]